MRLESLVPSFPDKDDDDFIEQITSKAEFYELKMGPIPQKTAPGELLYNQRLAARFMSPLNTYDRLLVSQGVGSGKTCLAALIAENFKQGRLPAVILTFNPDLVREIERQISEICFPDKYPVNVSRDDHNYNRQLRAVVKKHYKVTTYTNFAKEIRKTRRKGPEELVRLYSDRLFVFDEIHELVTDKALKEKVIVPEADEVQEKEDEEDEEEEDEEDEEDDEKEDEDEEEKARQHPQSGGEAMNISRDSKYNLILDMLTLLPRYHLVLMSGTVIWDNPMSMVPIINLLVPPSERLTFERFQTFFDEEQKLTDKGKKKLGDLFRGRVSYLRPSTQIHRTVVGTVSHGLRFTKIYPCKMKRIQREAYKIENKKRTRKSQLRKLGTNFVKYEDFYKKGTKDVKKVYFDEDNLKQYSIKTYCLLKLIRQHPTEKFFVYLNSVQTAGSIMLDRALRHNGVRSRVIDPRENVTRVIDAFNSDRNIYGEEIQVLIGTRRIATGLTLKAVRHMVFYESHWNFAQLDQAEGRVNRYQSLDQLPPSERTLNTYYFAAVLDDDDTESFDIHQYRTAEDKEYKTRQIYRMMKIYSYDCALGYERNVLEDDEDRSRECDFQSCNYRCHGYPRDYIRKLDNGIYSYFIPKENLTYNTFINVHDHQDLLMATIMNYFHRHFQGHYSTLKDECQRVLRKSTGADATTIELQDESLAITLFKLVSNRVPIRNRYGMECYLKEERDVYYLSTEVVGESSYDLLKYIQEPQITVTKTFNEVLLELLPEIFEEAFGRASLVRGGKGKGGKGKGEEEDDEEGEEEEVTKPGKDDLSPNAARKALEGFCQEPSATSFMALPIGVRRQLIEYLILHPKNAFAGYEDLPHVGLLKHIRNQFVVPSDTKGVYYYYMLTDASVQDKHIRTYVVDTKTTPPTIKEKNVINELKQRLMAIQEPRAHAHNIHGIYNYLADESKAFKLFYTEPGKPVGAKNQGQVCTTGGNTFPRRRYIAIWKLLQEPSIAEMVAEKNLHNGDTFTVDVEGVGKITRYVDTNPVNTNKISKVILKEFEKLSGTLLKEKQKFLKKKRSDDAIAEFDEKIVDQIIEFSQSHKMGNPGACELMASIARDKGLLFPLNIHYINVKFGHV